MSSLIANAVSSPSKHAKTKRLILGIDPGYDRCGWAVIAQWGSKLHPVAWDCVQTSAKETKQQRLAQVWEKLQTIQSEYPLTEVAMETLFFSKNVSTALPVSEARGLVFAFAIQHGLEIAEYAPNAIKLAVTGYGRAPKDQVTAMACRLLKLEKIPKIDDTGDALAVALTHALTGNTLH